MKTFQGKLQAKGFKIGIVVSRFNSFLSDRLLEGALEALAKAGAQEADLTVYKVPGSFEVPLVAKRIALAKAADGILCIGALVRGDTPHFDFLSAEVTKGLAQIAMDPLESGDEVGPEANRFVVLFIQREPGDRCLTPIDPVTQKRRLAKAGRSGNEDQVMA